MVKRYNSNGMEILDINKIAKKALDNTFDPDDFHAEMMKKDETKNKIITDTNKVKKQFNTYKNNLVNTKNGEFRKLITNPADNTYNLELLKDIINGKTEYKIVSNFIKLRLDKVTPYIENYHKNQAWSKNTYETRINNMFSDNEYIEISENTFPDLVLSTLPVGVFNSEAFNDPETLTNLFNFNRIHIGEFKNLKPEYFDKINLNNIKGISINNSINFTTPGIKIILDNLTDDNLLNLSHANIYNLLGENRENKDNTLTDEQISKLDIKNVLIPKIEDFKLEINVLKHILPLIKKPIETKVILDYQKKFNNFNIIELLFDTIKEKSDKISIANTYINLLPYEQIHLFITNVNLKLLTKDYYTNQKFSDYRQEFINTIYKITTPESLYTLVKNNTDELLQFIDINKLCKDEINQGITLSNTKPLDKLIEEFKITKFSAEQIAIIKDIYNMKSEILNTHLEVNNNLLDVENNNKKLKEDELKDVDTILNKNTKEKMLFSFTTKFENKIEPLKTKYPKIYQNKFKFIIAFLLIYIIFMILMLVYVKAFGIILLSILILIPLYLTYSAYSDIPNIKDNLQQRKNQLNWDIKYINDNINKINSIKLYINTSLNDNGKILNLIN